MRRYIGSAFLALALAQTLAMADPRPGKGHGKHGDGEEEFVAVPVETRYWGPGDVTVIRQHYAVPNLPPRLQKKLARTGTLPPGWEKRMRPLPPVVEQQLPPLCSYCVRGVVDNYAVVYDRRTRIIVDVLNLVADLRR